MLAVRVVTNTFHILRRNPFTVQSVDLKRRVGQTRVPNGLPSLTARSDHVLK